MKWIKIFLLFQSLSIWAFEANTCLLFFYEELQDNTLQTHSCTGVLVSDRQIITADHCISPISALSPGSVKRVFPFVAGCGLRKKDGLSSLCDQDKDMRQCIQENFSRGYLFKDDSYKIHQVDHRKLLSMVESSYRISTKAVDALELAPAFLARDIAKIDLLEEFMLFEKNKISSININKTELSKFTECKLEGFGSLDKNFMITPKEIVVPISKVECIVPGKKYLNSQITQEESSSCEIYVKGVMVHQGDSGGPLYCRQAKGNWELVGIASQKSDSWQDGIFSSFLSDEIKALLNTRQ